MTLPSPAEQPKPDPYMTAYDAWKADPSPAGNAAFLKELDPIIRKGVKTYGGSTDNPLLYSRARLLALEAARKYDPQKAKLQTHLLNNMRSLQRIQRQQQEVVRVPERVLLEQNRLKQVEQEFEDELGRSPTDDELTDRLGISRKRLNQIRRYRPGMTTGQVSAADPENGMPGIRIPGQVDDSSDRWAEIVYMDLSPIDKKIMEWTLGMNGQPKLSNAEIARKLRRSPGAITQRKQRIQQLLDQEQQLSPFFHG